MIQFQDEQSVIVAVCVCACCCAYTACGAQKHTKILLCI